MRRIDRSGASLQAAFFKLLFVFLLSLSLPFLGFGQGNEPPRELSEEEFAVILEKYQKFSRMDVHFSQTKQIMDLGLKLPSKGKLTVIRPDMVIWQINKPEVLKVVINSREISMQSGKSEIEKWPLDQVPEKMAVGLKEMVLWLKFDARALYQHFHIHSHGRYHYSFHTRKNKGGSFNFASMTMILDPRGNVKNMRMVEKSGDLIDILFDEPVFKDLP